MADTSSLAPWDACGDLRSLRLGLYAQAEGFWQTQEHILNDMEAMANAWFKRRHEGTAAALDAARALCATDDGSRAVHAYQKWLMGSAERVFADFAAAQAEAARFGWAWIDSAQGVATSIANHAAVVGGQSSSGRLPSEGPSSDARRHAAA